MQLRGLYKKKGTNLYLVAKGAIDYIRDGVHFNNKIKRCYRERKTKSFLYTKLSA